MNRKGIILAGGVGSRLAPLTKSVSKQLMPVYDKPMIYYPLSTLMLIGIREILVITSEKDQDNFKNLLGDGSQWGIKIKFKIQKKPEGIAQAFLIAEEFINNSPSVLILGDNLFYGSELTKKLLLASKKQIGATLFAYPVKDPSSYGIIEFDNNKTLKSIEEKPKNPKSKYAITGIYFYDNKVVEFSKNLKFSSRGELEITSINEIYLKNGDLNVEIMSRGNAWFDTGTFDSLHEASSYVRSIENRQGYKVGSPEEVSWRQGWISDEELKNLSSNLINSGYGQDLRDLIKK